MRSKFAAASTTRRVPPVSRTKPGAPRSLQYRRRGKSSRHRPNSAPRGCLAREACEERLVNAVPAIAGEHADALSIFLLAGQVRLVDEGARGAQLLKDPRDPVAPAWGIHLGLQKGEYHIVLRRRSKFFHSDNGTSSCISVHASPFGSPPAPVGLQVQRSIMSRSGIKARLRSTRWVGAVGLAARAPPDEAGNYEELSAEVRRDEKGMAIIP